MHKECKDYDQEYVGHTPTRRSFTTSVKKYIARFKYWKDKIGDMLLKINIEYVGIQGVPRYVDKLSESEICCKNNTILPVITVWNTVSNTWFSI